MAPSKNPSSTYLQYSLMFNAVCLIIIIYMVFQFKKYMSKAKEIAKSSEERSSVVSAKYKTIGDSDIQSVDKNNNLQKGVEKHIQTLVFDEKPVKLVAVQESNKKNSEERKLQIEKVSEQIQLKNLREELQLQQERGRYLQQEIKKFEESNSELKRRLSETEKELRNKKYTNPEKQVRTTQKRISEEEYIEKIPKKINSQTLLTSSYQEPNEDVRNLKNELQFCQKLLSQNYESQKDLKHQLSAYEKLGELTFNHPEFHRLRQKNKKYKQTILKLQRGLLSRSPRTVDNFSFNSD